MRGIRRPPTCCGAPRGAGGRGASSTTAGSGTAGEGGPGKHGETASAARTHLNPPLNALLPIPDCAAPLHPMSKRAMSPRTRLVISAVAGLAIAACVLLLMISSAGKTPAEQAQEKSAAMAAAREKERGFTDKVTVAVLADNAARPAQPRPGKLAPLIKAPAECKVTLDTVRDIIDANPTGLAAPASVLNALTASLSRIDRACAPDIALKFRQQELLPWQTWEVPAGYKIPTDAPAPSPAKAKRSAHDALNDKVNPLPAKTTTNTASAPDKP